MIVKPKVQLRGRKGTNRRGLIAVLGLAVVTVLLNLWAASASVGDTLSLGAGSQSPEPAAQIGNADLAEPREVSVQAQSGQPSSLHPASTVSHTVFLPLTTYDHWTPGELPYGVQIHWVDPDLVARTERMGAQWARTSLQWQYVEPANTTPENYQWPASMDEKFALLSASGIEVIVTIHGNPSWAAEYPGGPLWPEVDISEFTEFIQAAVERYSVPPYNVKYWEFYNEQDNGDEYMAELGWGYFGNTPDLYVDLLAAVYPAIKAADSEAQVVFGGLAYDNWSDDGGPFVREFLDGVLQHAEDEYQGVDYFDLMNFHYYSLWRHIWEPYGTGIIGKATAIRMKLADVEKPVICTEAGMWSYPSNDPIADPDGAEQQSRYVPQLYARSMAADLVSIIWFELVDTDIPFNYRSGLLTAGWQRKPSYYAYQTLSKQLGDTEYVRALDPGETGSDQIEAYEFVAGSETETILVAWTNDDAEHTMSLAAAHAVRVGKWGDRTTVDDGDLDGRVEVVVEPSPVYIRYAAGAGP